MTPTGPYSQEFMTMKTHQAVAPVAGKPLSRQQMLENVITYFLVEGKPFALKDGKCQYWTEEGNKCGIGCQFSDELAQRARAIRGSSSISALLNPDGLKSEKAQAFARELRTIIDIADTAFASELQGAHDNATNFNDDTPLPVFRHKLLNSLLLIANKYKLEFQPVVV